MVHRVAKSGSSSVLLLIIFWHHIFVARLQRSIRAVILWHHSHDVRHPRKIDKWGMSSWCFRSFGLKTFFHFVKCPLYQNLSPTPMCHSQVSLVYTLHRNFTDVQHVMAQILLYQQFNLLFMLNFDVWVFIAHEMQDYRAAKNVFFRIRLLGLKCSFWYFPNVWHQTTVLSLLVKWGWK